MYYGVQVDRLFRRVRKVFKLMPYSSRRVLWRAALLRIVPVTELLPVLSYKPYCTVLDVGANRGQFAALTKLVLPDATIIAFEPLQNAAKACERLLDDGDALHGVALGQSSTNATLYVTDPPDSSSLRQPTLEQSGRLHSRSFGRSQVSVRRMDELVQAADLVRPVLLKVDVQGTEMNVFRGATDVLLAVDTIVVELSFVELYARQELASDVVRFLFDCGFGLTGLINVAERRDGSVEQGDFIFDRLDAASV